MENINKNLLQVAYNIDASHIDSQEDLEIFFPTNSQDIQDILSRAIQENKKIIPRGAGTNLVGNCLPISGSIIVDFSQMNKIIKIQKDSVTVEPGIVSDELNYQLQKQDKRFPVIIGSHLVSQIGGMIATDAAGMKAIKYGSMMDRVNRIKIATINKDKEVEFLTLKTEDLNAFRSSEGILGIITEANLKITEFNNKRSITYKSFENLSDLIAQAQNYKNFTNVSAIEYLNPKVAGFLGLENKYYLFVEFEDTETGEIQDPEEIKEIWKSRDACYAKIVEKGYECIEDPQIELDKAIELLNWFEERNVPAFGHIGTGIFHPHFTKEQTDLIEEMYSKVKKAGGKVSGEHGIGIKKKQYLTEEEKQYYQQLKNKYDPLNFLGGNSII